MMENRSFDHLLGWLSGADGRQAGLTYADVAGRPQRTRDLTTDFRGCAYEDPKHDWQSSQRQLDGGKADGFLLTQLVGNRFPIGCYPRDAATWPNVSFVEPNCQTIPELLGTSNDDHPHGSIRSGEGFIQQVYEAVVNSPQWDRTVMVLNFDEWGGFFDHVVPPKVMDDTVNPDPGPRPDYRQLGFRVPCILISPFAPARIEHGGPYEHCSILRMIEWRWDMPPMSARDERAKNLAEVLDFSARRTPVRLPAFTTPAPVECPPQ